MAQAPRWGPGSGARERPHALIVEDDADARELYALSMRAAGWQVATATNGIDAVLLAERLVPDVIVMDMNLPLVDGIEATRRLRRGEETATIPIIACTAFGEPWRAELDGAGFDAVVRKPCSAEDLLCTVEAVVTARRAGR
jgi:CheY-like chemotaxis protein